MYDKLIRHVGHNIDCASYADGQNVAIECLDCNEILVDEDEPIEYEGMTAIVNINLEIPTNGKTADEAEKEAEDYELPSEYVSGSYEFIKAIDPKCETI